MTARARPLSGARILGLILAGGEGRRLGGADKALLPFGGAPLLSRVQGRLDPQVEGLALSANGDPERFAFSGLTVLGDAGPERLGPMAGVLAGLDWLHGQGATHLATVPVDLPFLPPDLVARLSRAGDFAVAECGGRLHPTCTLWPLRLRDPLARALAAGERRIGRWCAEAGAVRVVFPAATPDPFFNVNRPEDLAEAERLAG